MSNAPKVTIGKGKAQMTPERIAARIERIELALEKPTVKEPKRALLQAELDYLSGEKAKIKELLA